MTGPEHYAEAEAQLAAALTCEPDDPCQAAGLAAAQIHATLALAAATAEPIATAYVGDHDATIPRAWSQAIS